MRKTSRLALLTITLPLLLTGVALGGEGVQLKITNNGTKDVLVTVYDNNARPRKAVLENTRVSSFTSVPVSVMADDSGMGNVTWTAITNDGTSRKCGRADTQVSDDGTIMVKAEDSCSSAAAG